MTFRFLTAFILLYSLAAVDSTCHTCQSNFAVCHDERRFTMCTEGISGDEMQTCPNGYVCTGETQICLRSTEANPVQSTCEGACGLCKSAEKLFACVDPKTYAYCFGADVPDYTATGVCPDGYVCNLGSAQVCTSASVVYPSCYDGASSAPTTLPPTTSTGTIGNSDSTGVTSSQTDSTSVKTSDSTAVIDTTTVGGIVTTNTVANPSTDPSSSTESQTTVLTTTNAPTTTTVTISTQNPRDETTFCRDKQNGGIYRAENDSTCQEFVLCYILSGQYLGIKYSCSGSEFFNDDTKTCQVEKPADCT